MDQKQTNRVTMFKTVANFLDQNNSAWSGMKPLATTVQQFKGKIGAIDAVAQKQETPIKGAAGDKASARDALEEVLFLMCEALGVLANTAGDFSLLALVAVTPAGLQKLGDEELSNRATTVLGKANAKANDLAALDVTQANIDELNQALENFNGTKEKPRTATAERSAQTTSLPTLIRDGSDLLRNQVDRLVNLFRRSNSQFVAGYRSARVIIDRPGSHAAPKKPTSAPQLAQPSPVGA